MKEVFKTLLKIVSIIAAMGGILLDKLSWMRFFQFTAMGIIYLIYRQLYMAADLRTAIIVFICFFCGRYFFLFLSFVKNGIADRLKNRYGEEKGFEIYQTVTALQFFTGSLSFTLIIIKSGLTIPFSGNFLEIIKIAGYVIAAAGLIINIWSTYLVGIDVYYYKDLFLGRKISEFKFEGPYKIFSNPMYGPGQANGYGTALIYGSAGGITGMLLNQLMMYIFFFTIEKPHIKRIS